MLGPKCHHEWPSKRGSESKRDSRLTQWSRRQTLGDRVSQIILKNAVGNAVGFPPVGRRVGYQHSQTYVSAGLWLP